MGIVDRLLGNLNPTLPGPLNDLPMPVKLAISNAGPWAFQTNPVLRKGVDTSAQAGKGIAGELALLAALGQVASAGHFGVDPNSATTQTARQMLAQGPLHPRGVIDAASQSKDKETALLGGIVLPAVSDPSNYVVPAAANFARGAEYTRLASMLDDVNRMQNLPVEGLAQGVRNLRNRQLLREASKLTGAETPDLITAAKQGDRAALDQLRQRIEDAAGFQVGDVPRGQLPRIGEGRGLGPPQNPPRRLPGDLGDQLRRQYLTPLDAPDNAPLAAREMVGGLPTRPDADYNTRASGSRAPRLGADALLPLPEGATFQRGAAGDVGDLARMAERLGLTPRTGQPLDDLLSAAQRLTPEPPASTPLTPPALPETLGREPTFAYGPPTTLQEAAQRLGITARPSQAPNTPLELLMAARGTVKTPTPLPTPPTPTSPLNAATGTLDDFNALLAGPWSTSKYIPPAEAFSKRLNVPVEQAQQWLDDLVARGVAGRLPDGELAFLPKRAIANATPNAAPIAIRDLSGMDLTPPTDAITPAQERLARLANEDALIGEPRIPAAPDFPVFATRDEGIASLSPEEIQTLVDVAYPSDAAQGNALLARGNPTELASRAIDRITGTATDSPSYRSVEARGRLAVLAQRDPALAQKIALLPEPAGAALPDLANGDIPTVVQKAPISETSLAPIAQTDIPTVDYGQMLDSLTAPEGKTLSQALREHIAGMDKDIQTYTKAIRSAPQQPLRNAMGEVNRGGSGWYQDMLDRLQEGRAGVQKMLDLQIAREATPSAAKVARVPDVSNGDIVPTPTIEPLPTPAASPSAAELFVHVGRNGSVVHGVGTLPDAAQALAAKQLQASDFRVTQRADGQSGWSFASPQRLSAEDVTKKLFPRAAVTPRTPDALPVTGAVVQTAAPKPPAWQMTHGELIAAGVEGEHVFKQGPPAAMARQVAALPQPASGRTYYHAVPADYQPGDPLYSMTELRKVRGTTVPNKWGDEFRGYRKSPDARHVAVAEAYATAYEFNHQYLNGEGQILAIHVPAGTKLTRNSEGYAQISKMVPAEWIEVMPSHHDQVAAALSQGLTVPAKVLAEYPDLATKTKPPPGGDIAAGGGGGMGLLPYPGGLTGPIGRAIVPAAGAGAGAGIGYLTGDNPEDARANALKGAAIGGALGAGLEYSPQLAGAAGRIVAPGSTWRSLGTEAARNARTAQRDANALSLKQAPVPTTVGDWLGLWKRQVVETPRNWLQDEAWGRIVLRALQPGGTAALNPLRKDAARYLNNTTTWEKLPTATRGILTDLGRPNYVPQLGESLSQELRHGKELGTVAQATGGAALSLLNPVGAATSVLGVATGGALGAARPSLSAVFRTINDFQHNTFRLAAFNDELANLVGGGAEDFLRGLTARGVDVSILPTSGSFSPAQVGALAGPTAERQWAAITSKAVTLAEQRTKFLFGDYAQKNIIEQALGGAIPFMSWVTRAYPVAVRMALDHPVVALAVYQYYRATSQGAGKDGRPGWTTGMVPIPTSTPYVGPLLSALVPGQQGVVYVDPVGAFSPVGADLFFGNGEDATDPNTTWYQKATATLARLGLSGPNPLVQAGAYVTGLDYKSPGALSRTAGLEQGLALIPGNPQLPNVGANLLAGARAKVSDAIGPAIGGKADPYAAAYDPITRRYGELVYERTGHTLQDPTNRAYLVALTDAENPLVQQARREVLLSGAVKNALSLVNPTNVATQGQTPRDYQAARGKVPFSAEQIATAEPYRAYLMQQRNKEYQARTPLLDVYQGTKPYQREDILQAQWADQPDVKYVQRVLPKSYNQQKQQQKLELWVFDNRALKRSNPAEYQRQLAKKRKALGLD